HEQRTQFRRGAARAGFDTTLREAQCCYAGELEARAGRDHSHIGFRRSGQAKISSWLEDSEALSSSGGAAEVVRVTFQTNYGSACGPVIVPVFKTGGRHLRCRRCVRLTHASASSQQLADHEITRNQFTGASASVKILRGLPGAQRRQSGDDSEPRLRERLCGTARSLSAKAKVGSPHAGSWGKAVEKRNYGA